jgi:hypothetical protein
MVKSEDGTRLLSMKQITISIATFAIAFSLATLKAAAFDQVGSSGEVSNHIEMSISLNGGGTNVPVNQSVVLKIVLKNLYTNETFSVYNSIRDETDQAYSFVITTPSGTNKTILTGTPHNGAIITIPPGETREREFNLSRLNSFQEIGVYKIVAKYKNLWGAPYFEATSNPLEVNVVKAVEVSETPKTNNPIMQWFP